MTAWVLLALPTGVSILLSGHGPVELSEIAGFAVWGVVWAWLWWRGVNSSLTGAYVGVVAVTVLMSLFTLIAPTTDNSFLVFAFIAAGVCLPPRRAVWAFIALVIIQLGLQLLRLTPAAIIVNLIINSVLVGALGIGARIFWQSYTQLVA